MSDDTVGADFQASPSRHPETALGLCNSRTGCTTEAEIRARVIGKPSAAFYAQAVHDLRKEAGRDLARGDIAMVGDDVRTDVRAAQRSGLRGILVLSGKHSEADADVAARERGGRRPDAIAPDLGAVVAALD